MEFTKEELLVIKHCLFAQVVQGYELSGAEKRHYILGSGILNKLENLTGTLTLQQFQEME